MPDAMPHDRTAPPPAGMSGRLHAADLVLRFLLEIAALAALGYWGFRTADSFAADVLLGLGAPMLGAAVWGTFAAPKPSKRLHGAALLAVQLTVLLSGAVALIAAGQPVLGAVFAVLVVVNALLMKSESRQG